MRDRKWGRWGSAAFAVGADAAANADDAAEVGDGVAAAAAVVGP